MKKKKRYATDRVKGCGRPKWWWWCTYLCQTACLNKVVTRNEAIEIKTIRTGKGVRVFETVRTKECRAEEESETWIKRAKIQSKIKLTFSTISTISTAKWKNNETRNEKEKLQFYVNLISERKVCGPNVFFFLNANQTSYRETRRVNLVRVMRRRRRMKDAVRLTSEKWKKNVKNKKKWKKSQAWLETEAS